ncbi:MAG: hypothetical protein ACPL0B_00145 [Anaerolineales bacterium]
MPNPPSISESFSDSKSEATSNRKIAIYVAIALIVILALVILSTYWLLNHAQQTSVIRDIFIIFMALETLLLGVALIILIIQLARLINLLQNEIKPILNTTNETVSTLKGTTTFLSDNLVEPVMKLNELLAGFQKLIQIVGLTKKK